MPCAKYRQPRAPWSFTKGRRLGAPANSLYHAAAVASLAQNARRDPAPSQAGDRTGVVAAAAPPPCGTPRHLTSPRGTTWHSVSQFPTYQLIKKQRGFLNRFARGKGLKSQAEALARAHFWACPSPWDISSRLPTQETNQETLSKARLPPAAQPAPKTLGCAQFCFPATPPSEAADGRTYCTDGCERPRC